ncbi:MAG TPA: hypothetical protein VEA44_02190 [Caulobacter sp.]|nr:hypothetical protein [Caulobacter sp.]
MTTEYPANTRADLTRPNGAANEAPLGGFLDRFFGGEQATAMKEDLKDRALEARDTLKTAKTSLMASARAHPLLAIAAVVGGIAAIGLLANPATRRAAIAGGAGLWGKYGHMLKARTPGA